MNQGATAPLIDLSGQWLGPFHLIRLLGQGAMGSVYLAKDDVLRREVALKVLAKAEGGLDEERYDRFIREARAAARLIHPNVVQIFQVGDDAKLRYIAMEYVEGMTMRQAAKQQGGKLPEQVCIEKMRDAADALKLADSFGICHRDIKPANLLLTRAGALKIADFGLASQVEGSESIGPGAVSRFEGTPYYMSPEQWYGGPITTSADVYCLASTFYHLVTGTTPYPPRDLLGCFRAHTMDPVPDPRKVLPNIDGDFADLLMRSMAKFAAERPTAGEVVEVLDELLAVRHRVVRSRSALPPPMPPSSSTPTDVGNRTGETSQATSRSRETNSALASASTPRSSTGVRMVGGASSTQSFAAQTQPGAITRPETLGSQSYHQFFGLATYPFSDIRHPSSYWDAPPFGSTLRMLATEILEEKASPTMLLGPPGSGRTFLCEMLKNKHPEISLFVIEPQLLFGVQPMLTLCRQHGAPQVNPRSSQRTLIDTFLATSLPQGSDDAIALIVVDGLDPDDREFLAQLDDILTHAPRNRLAMLLVGGEELPERLAAVGAPKSLLSGPAPCVLRPLTPKEMLRYIDFRMKTIGECPDGMPLDLPSQQLLHARSGGSPKLINVFCHNALTIAALKQEKTLKLSSVRLGLKSKSYMSADTARAMLMGG